MSLPDSLRRRLKLPVICAPMFRVSGPELVIAACRAGIIGAFPTANCRSVTELDGWLTQIGSALTPEDAPFCPNLIVRHEGVDEQLRQLVRHRVELVITSVGSPHRVVPALHEIGCLVFADVASLRHAHKAVQAGADGLVLLSAGAGGQTGWVNGFSFARAVRQFFDGPLILAGGMSDGHAVWAARSLGCDLAYMGTPFIATHESGAAPQYKEMLVSAEFDDILLSDAFTGLPANMLRPSVVAAGLDPASLPVGLGEEGAAALFGKDGEAAQRRWRDVWSAGHSVSGVRAITSAADRVTQTRVEYDEARTAAAATDD